MSLRVSGLYFAITTFIFTLVLTVLATDLQITGGLQGLLGPAFPDFPDSLAWLGAPVAWCVMLGAASLHRLVWNIRQIAALSRAAVDPRRRALRRSRGRAHLAHQDRRFRPLRRDGGRRGLAVFLPRRRVAGPVRLGGFAEHSRHGADRRHQHDARPGDRRGFRLDVPSPRQHQSLAAGDGLWSALHPRHDPLPGRRRGPLKRAALRRARDAGGGRRDCRSGGRRRRSRRASSEDLAGDRHGKPSGRRRSRICGRMPRHRFQLSGPGRSVLRNVDSRGEARSYPRPYRPERLGQEHARQCHRRPLAPLAGTILIKGVRVDGAPPSEARRARACAAPSRRRNWCAN